MARYKPQDRHSLMLAVVLSEQIVPGSFAFALNYLVDNEFDLSALDAQFKNDEVCTVGRKLGQGPFRTALHADLAQRSAKIRHTSLMTKKITGKDHGDSTVRLWPVGNRGFLQPR